MIKIETMEVAGFRSAIKGMRNPMNSWHLSDSRYEFSKYVIGNEDMKLAKKLIKAGPEHCKFLRMIQVWIDIEMPRYIWQELDTYHFGTKNSCSTMHKLHDKTFSIYDFYIGEMPASSIVYAINEIIRYLNVLRNEYLQTKNYSYVVEMKRMLPESYLQLRTWNTNYQELINIYKQRKNHRLKDEWTYFCDWCETLPYFLDFVGE